MSEEEEDGVVVMQWFRRGLVGEGDVVVDAGSPGVVGGVRGRRWPRRSEVVGDGRAGPSSRSAEGERWIWARGAR